MNSPAKQPATAIVCRPKGMAPVRSLHEGLVRRGFAVEEVETTHAAAARAMLVSREAKGFPIVVVLMEPSRLVRPQELVAALSSGIPDCACWVFEGDGASAQVRAVRPEDLAAWGESGKAALAKRNGGSGKDGGEAAKSGVNNPGPGPYQSGTGGKGSPSLRLTGEWQDEPAQGAPQADERPEATGHLLSDDELSMLLGESEEDPGAADSGG
jgi:hypothetical protein